ncbi:MAG: MFS transporter [Candidatus Brachytrichaceae bacterium NZ_4S206]|jgi:MFS family permease
MQQTIESAQDGLPAVQDAKVPAYLLEARRNLHRLQTVIRFASLATSALVVALPIYSSNFNASGLEKGLLFAIPAFMMAIARPIIGRSMDLYGRKFFLCLGVGILFLAMVLFIFAREFSFQLGGMAIQADASFAVTMLFIARTVQGFGLGTMLLSSYTITADLARQSGRGSSFGYTEEAQYRGGLYGGLVAVPILLLFGFDPTHGLRLNQTVWSVIFVMYALGALLAFVLAVRTVPETRKYALIEAEREEEIRQKIDPQLYVLMAIVMLTTASSYGLAPFILTFIQDHLTQNLLLIAMAYIPAALIWAFLPSRLGRVADRVGRKPPMVVGLTMSGLFSLTIPFLSMVFPSVNMAVFALMLFATLEAACYAAAVPAEQAMVADMTGGRQRGIGFGLYTLAQSMGQVFGPLVMGVLYDWDRAGPFLANAVILIIGSLLVVSVLQDPAKRRRSLVSVGK